MSHGTTKKPIAVYYRVKKPSLVVLLLKARPDSSWLTSVIQLSMSYSFAGDLLFEDYLELLNKYFDIKKIAAAREFAGYPLSKIGDALDGKIIIGTKKSKL